MGICSIPLRWYSHRYRTHPLRRLTTSWGFFSWSYLLGICCKKVGAKKIWTFIRKEQTNKSSWIRMQGSCILERYWTTSLPCILMSGVLYSSYCCLLFIVLLYTYHEVIVLNSKTPKFSDINMGVLDVENLSSLYM